MKRYEVVKTERYSLEPEKTIMSEEEILEKFPDSFKGIFEMVFESLSVGESDVVPYDYYETLTITRIK